MIFRARTFEVVLPVERDPTFAPGCSGCGRHPVAGQQPLVAYEVNPPLGAFTPVHRLPPALKEVQVPLCQGCLGRWLWTPFVRLLGCPILSLALAAAVLTFAESMFNPHISMSGVLVGGLGFTLLLADLGLHLLKRPLPVHLRNAGAGLVGYQFAQAACAQRFAAENAASPESR